MFGVFGLAVAVAAASRRVPRGAVAIAALLCALCVADAVGHVQLRRDLFVTNVRNINELDVEMAKWVKANTPPDARLMVCDVGAISYFSNRHCTDTVGLVTPELLPYLELHAVAGEPFAETPLARFLEDTRPDYLIIFPDWYPRVVTALDKLPLAQRVKEFHIEDNLTCGGDAMVAYRFEWPKQGAD